MADHSAKNFKDVETDADILAIRSLVNVSQTAPAVRSETHTPKLGGISPGQAALPPNTTEQRAQLAKDADASPPQSEKPSLLKVWLSRAIAWATWQIKNYRPISKNILFTSAVLLLLLKPAMMIGWALVLLIGLIATFLFMGGDRFWRKIIALFQAYAARNPIAARQVKLRAYVMAKRWDRFLRRLPDAIADTVRVPDLRELVKADARHDAALSDRLSRLQEDPLTRF